MVVNTEFFTFKNGVFSAEMSDFGNNQLGTFFQLKSEKTGKTIDMTLDRVERDQENEIIAYHYKPVFPGPCVRAVVFND